MNVYNLNIETVHQPNELVRFFEDNEVRKGDTLKIITEEEKNSLVFTAVVVIVILALLFSWNTSKKKSGRRRKDEEDPILDDLFKGKTIEEIEKEMETEYGVKIEVEQKEDEEFRAWKNQAAINFMRTYDVNEPDYTENDIQEPNPLYQKKWKGK